MLETPGTFNVGGYGQEIHEMTEMRAVAMGQYGHNNQPAHHFLYLFALLGEHDTTARTVRCMRKVACRLLSVVVEAASDAARLFLYLRVLYCHTTVPAHNCTHL